MSGLAELSRLVSFQKRPHPWLACSWTARSGNAVPVSRASSPAPGLLSWAGWAGRGTAGIIGVFWQPAARGLLSHFLPASGAGLGPLEPVRLVWRLLLLGRDGDLEVGGNGGREAVGRVGLGLG